MAHEIPVARRAAAYRVISLAKAAIARGDHQTAEALFARSTDILNGEIAPDEATLQPANPHATQHSPQARAYAKTILQIYGRA